jgi:hypothetical protein
MDPVAIVGNLRSASLVRRLGRSLNGLRSVRPVPVIAPGFLPLLNSSDHWSFWKAGYKAAMVTDGGPFRYGPHHRQDDRIEHVDFDRLDDLAGGLAEAVRELTN